MEVLAITQARIGSSRLPGKVLKNIAGTTLLGIHLHRILRSKKISKLVVATTHENGVEAIVEVASKMSVQSYQGSLENVLDRFYQAAKPHTPKWVVRITSDCPLVDPVLIDTIIEKAVSLNVDYCSNTLQPTYPDGIDIEVFKFTALEKAWKEATLRSDQEHVTPFIYNNSTFKDKKLFTSFNYLNDENYGQVRLTVDEPYDYEVVKILVEKLGIDRDWKTYADYYLADPEIKKINEHIKRNEGYKLS